MSDDHTDELLSAYIDGEATPGEVARVEADPELRAELELLRAVAERLSNDVPTAPAALRKSHIASAMELFDRLGTGDGVGTSTAADEDGRADDGPAPPIDLMARRRRGQGTDRGLPLWLGTAAAFALMVGGISWVVGRAGSGDEASDTAAVAIEDDARGAEEAGGDDADRSSTLREGADGAPTDVAESAAADGEMGLAADSFDEDDGAVADDARLALTGPPTAAELAELVEGDLVDVTGSSCGGRVEAPAGSEFIGFVPISVGGEPGEVLAYLVDGERIGWAVDGACRPLG